MLIDMKWKIGMVVVCMVCIWDFTYNSRKRYTLGNSYRIIGISGRYIKIVDDFNDEDFVFYTYFEPLSDIRDKKLTELLR